ncbi:DegV family EDD domain-containing protein [Lactobacillus sp. S2-2]|uniref:DegV family protein n=1 Tax=Lactobacillus sp. S2-2 TaxID=2692917 RepID=UPI001F2DA158|nr:DegV family protein [Lactobacillus sp. S2-2]MCF6515310.1 DegV family EDD domain-containing protein [Lactobacillus sp. S2-2]
MIHVVTDSTAQLTSEEIKENNIKIIPLQINDNGKSYTDGVDITRQEFSNRLANEEGFPQTSQPALGQFVQTYQEIIDEDPDAEIISFHITSFLSGTSDTAKTAAQQFDNRIEAIDSESTDRGQSFQILAAAQKIKDGKSMNEIIAENKSIIDNINLFVFVNSLEYLVKGGRASKMTGFISSLIQIKPVLELKDNVLGVKQKYRGKKRLLKAADELTEKVIADESVSEVCLSYVDDDTEVNKIADKIKSERPDIKVIAQLTSPIVMTHVGPGGFGYIYK